VRTTVTLDPDVAKAIDERMRERGTGFKATVNELLRSGLRADAPATVAYEIPVFDSAIRPGVDLDKALALAAAMEDEELLRRVGVGK
jgi:hypothetical protein